MAKTKKNPKVAKPKKKADVTKLKKNPKVAKTKKKAEVTKTKKRTTPKTKKNAGKKRDNKVLALRIIAYCFLIFAISYVWISKNTETLNDYADKILYMGPEENASDVQMQGAGGTGVSGNQDKNTARRDEEEVKMINSLAFPTQGISYPGYAMIINESGRGVTLDKKGSWDGLNLFTPQWSKSMYLMDNKENIVHTWSLDDGVWVDAKLMDDKTLIGIYLKGKRSFIGKFDWDSNMLWENGQYFYHHGFAVAPDGSIYALGGSELSPKSKRLFEMEWGNVTIADNKIIKLSGDGEVLGTASVYDVLKDYIPQGRMHPPNRRSDYLYDIFHTTSIDVAQTQTAVSNVGDILITVRNFDMVFILDFENKKVKWAWGDGELQWPSLASFTDDGNILIFDNGVKRLHSRIVKVDPQKNETIWEYSGSPDDRFYTGVRGYVQQLPNGDYLITVSNKAIVFEVGEDGKKVWKYVSDYVEGENRKIINRMRRYPKELVG